MNNFPTPEELAQYENISPEITEYFKETQQKILDNERELEIRRINTERLQYLCALLSILPIALLSGYAFYLKYPNQALYIACTVIVGLAGVFITGRFIKR